MSRATLQWLSLISVIWLQSINGTNSNFPAYSSQLKQLLSLSQLQLNNLAFASDAGKLFGWVSGIAAIYLPLWLVLLMGSILGLVGYGVQYLFLTHRISSLGYLHLFFLTVLAGNSICWINTVSYIVTIRNFAFHRQTAVGLTTSYLGLSAMIYTTIVNAVSSVSLRRAELYLLLNSCLPVIVSIIATPFVRNVHSNKSKSLSTGFVLIFMITIATGVYAIVISLGSTLRQLSQVMNVVGIGLCLAIPLVIPLAESTREFLEQKCFINRETRVRDLSIENSDGVDSLENSTKDEESIIDVDEVKSIENIGSKLMLTRVNFWLYFLVYFCGATLGLVYLNNLGQIAESRGYSETSSLVSLSSAFVFFGRLLPSLLDYAYSRTNSIVPGPGSIAVAMVPLSGAFFLLLNGSNLSLHVSTAIVSFSMGAITTLSVSTTTELFGPKNFGVNHNVVVANIPLGSFLFGDIAALFYRREGDGHGKCMGLGCFRMSFIIWGSLCSLGTVLALILHVRTRKFYSNHLGSIGIPRPT